MLKKLASISLYLIILLGSTPCFAQGVEHDFYQDGYRHINTSSTTVLTPSKSHFPISISLCYYGKEDVHQYYLRLYGRYELSEDTKLVLCLDDGTELYLDAYASEIYHSRLGLVKMKTIFDAKYLITNEQLTQILSTTIVSIKIKTKGDWHSKTFKHNKIGNWLKLNYREINKKLTIKQR